ncbi:LysR family transcriptional regulator [Piscinibacter sp.]|uniref:LysR family transcriptional regulator n=1 Tax=Piscinibacter sp. TaxID=1903157 RepID=UPI002CCAB638|nr:LysR substrate-binding domain-containing protein [Albitalea sp.]HUG26067.1 LysR substrate-binding domain-containing protein [Albitalea sp.]
MQDVDLNLLRLFDTVYRTGNISRAAEQLGMSQPATSQALTRLRTALGDHLFERTPGGVRPTQRAERLARSVQAGLALLEAGLADDDAFEPRTSSAELRLHLTDIGEARFLPFLMAELRRAAPGIRVKAKAWPKEEIAQALDNGLIHFAIGFLPGVDNTAKVDLLTDRYVLLMRSGHPLADAMGRKSLSIDHLRRLDLISVQSHAQTLRILHSLNLESRIRLVTSTFLALPAIVRNSDLAVVLPQAIAAGFEPADCFRVVEARLPAGDFNVALHWSRRHEHAPMLRWARELLVKLFRTPA